MNAHVAELDMKVVASHLEYRPADNRNKDIRKPALSSSPQLFLSYHTQHPTRIIIAEDEDGRVGTLEQTCWNSSVYF